MASDQLSSQSIFHAKLRTGVKIFIIQAKIEKARCSDASPTLTQEWERHVDFWGSLVYTTLSN
jgi:hypothetical protein